MPTLHSMRRPLSRARPARLLVLPLLLALVACSSSPTRTQTPTQTFYSNVKLEVTNATCISGTCSPVTVIAFPENAPLTPEPWFFDLGTVTTAAACLTVPAKEIFVVTGVRTADTTTWTPKVPFALGTKDTANAFASVPSTPYVAAALYPGWQVSLPGGKSISGAPPCSP